MQIKLKRLKILTRRVPRTTLIVVTFFLVALVWIMWSVATHCNKTMSNENDEYSCRCHSSYNWTNWTQSSVGTPKSSRILSTCSDERSFIRVKGQKQNVVAFSYLQPDPCKKNLPRLLALYYKGMLENLAAIRKYYPGFVMRIYTNVPLRENDTLCEMLCSNTDLQWCDVRKTPGFGDLSRMFFMTWRFLPMGDPTVGIFLSRDLDSVISEREFSATNEWMVTRDGKPIIIMRDHQDHLDRILGGLWGSSNDRLGGPMATSLQARIIAEASTERRWKHEYGFDQSLLSQMFWPLVKKFIVAYDSYHCVGEGLGKDTEVRPFPVQRKNKESDFVGNPDLGRMKWKLDPCPEQCRPRRGKNWTYC